MPSRILREGILTSEAINSLSPLAELFYRRLQSVADDYGRYYAHLTTLRVNCYPLRPDSVTESDVKKWLDECCKAKNEKGEFLVTIYGDGKYLFISNFGQQTRSKSKFPDPKSVNQSQSTQIPKQPVLIKCLANDNQMLSLVGVGCEVGVGVVCDIKEATPILKSNLLPLYNRKVTDRLTSIEESSLFEISRRPEVRSEIGVILAYRQREPKYFPRSLSSLVSNWQENLDRARTGKPIEAPKSEHPNTAAVRRQMEKEGK